MKFRQSLYFGPLWAVTRGDPRVVVAILDGPVETNHACLSGARLELVSVSSSPNTPDSLESQRHGTHVTSQIFAKGDCGLVGIAPECTGLLMPVYRGTADGGLISASQVDLARAIRLAVDRGANIINISGGELSPSPEASKFLTDALTYCEQEGVLVVAAAGNNGCECLHVPASVASVLAVGALDPRTGEPTDFSNWGSAYRNNAILAPGRGILGAQAGGGLATRSGTSFAAPIVTGVAALLMSVQLKLGKAVNARAVRAAILNSATRCDAAVAGDCRPYLVGTLDLQASLGLLIGNGAHLEASQTVWSRGDGGSAKGALQMDGVAAAEFVEGADAVVCSEAMDCNGADGDSEPGPGGLEALSATCALPDPNVADMAGTRSVQPSNSNESEGQQLAPGSIRILGGAATIEAATRILKFNNQKGDLNMSNEQLVTTDAPKATELVTPNGVEASGPVAQKDEDMNPSTPTGVEPSGAVAPSSVDPSECDCQPAGPRQLVFALGELGYDLVTEARKDSLWQAMHKNPYEWKNMIAHLKSNPWDAADVTWTLRIDATPIYAIQPAGPFALDAYKRLVEILEGFAGNKVERISIPGWIAGATQLTSGITVPVVVPTMRGIFSWDTKSLAEAATKGKNGSSEEGVANFLQRIYYELRNLGQSPQERALNFAATDAYQVSEVFQDATVSGHVLDSIGVEKSPICRQDSDCWDVTLTFFDPQNDRAARDVHRFTVDVSDVVPCTIGAVRRWSIR